MRKILNYYGDSSVSAADRMLARNIYNREKSTSVSYNSKSLDEKIELTYSALEKLKKLHYLGTKGETERRVVSTYGAIGLDFLKKVQKYVKKNGVEKTYQDLNSVLRKDIASHISELKWRESLRLAS